MLGRCSSRPIWSGPKVFGHPLLVGAWFRRGLSRCRPMAEASANRFRRIEKLATDLKAWLRKAEPYDKTNSRFERIKDLARASETLQTQYRNFIQNVIEDRPAVTAGLYEQVSGIRLLFDRLINDIDSVVSSTALTSLPKTARNTPI